MKRKPLPLLVTAALLALLLFGCAVPETGDPTLASGTLPGLTTPTAPEVTAPEAPETLLYATGRRCSTAAGTMVEDEVAFSDDWFLRDPAEANPALALCSMQLEAACCNASDGAAFLTALGFANVEARHYEARSIEECAYTTGEKLLRSDGAEYTLRAVFIQGSWYDDSGWEQNMTVNDSETSGRHRGYVPAAAQVVDELLPHGAGNEIWWVVGFSRGAGIANLTAASLAEAGQTVFGYTFASPAVTDDAGAARGPVYAGIHNYLCDDDPVPMVPPWGMVRYGQDHSLSAFSAEEVTASLQARDPAAWEQIGGYDGMWTVSYDKDGNPAGGVTVAEFLGKLLQKLQTVVPTRADYSAPHVETFAAQDETGEITWVPQDSMICLVRLLSGPGVPGTDSTEELLPLLAELVGTELEARLAEQNGDAAMAAEAAGRRWQTAQALCAASPEAGADPEGIYGILCLVSPLLVKPDSVLRSGKLPDFGEDPTLLQLVPYAPEAVNLLSSGGELVFSHHVDTLIVRLRLLCEG